MTRRAKAVVVGLSLLVVLYVALGGLLGRTVSGGAYQQLAVFSEVLAHVQNDYVEDPDMPRVTIGALRGLLESLDPYSGYLSPREYAEYQQKKQKPPEGDVGLVLSKRLTLISVVTVLPDSPAARAELETGDLLEAIAGFSTREMAVEQAYMLLRGEPGTSVKLSVVHETRAEPQPLDLVRARLRPARVLSGRLEGDVGYLKVTGFEQGRANDIRDALRRLHSQGAQKLVLDLRDCATGAAEEAVDTARLLLASGLITYAQGQKYPRQQFGAEPARVVWSGPLAVLINTGTAGPAEIVAAAVLDNHRGAVIGQRSYGVGAVQRVIPLEDGAALVLSVAKYYGPAGRALQDFGVRPSVTVEPPDDRAAAPVPHALPAPGDPVVLKALEVLRGEATQQVRPAA